MRPGSKNHNLGILLMSAGTLWLLSSLGIFGRLPGFVWVMSLFGMSGAFLVLTKGQLPWWQRLGGFAGLAIMGTATSGAFAGAAVLGFIAQAFGLVYFMNKRQWWALIPGGIFGSLALMVAVNTLLPRWDASPLLFLGFAATFTTLYLMPATSGGQRWALYPAIVFIALTVLINNASSPGSRLMMPLLLIGAGTVILWFWWQENKDKPKL